MSAWDDGVIWRPVLVEGPLEEPLDLAYVRDKHLKVNNGTVEDVFIEESIRTARELCESFTHRAVPPQTWSVVLDKFPTGFLELPKPPLIEVVSVEYRDSAGTLVAVDAADYYVVPSSGSLSPHSSIVPISSWPTAATRRDAVVVTFRAGYEDTSQSPAVMNVPSALKSGMALVVGELYKQRSLSVHGFGVGQSPAVLSAEYLWTPYRVELAVA